MKKTTRNRLDHPSLLPRLALLLACMLPCGGCSTVRPLANGGHDLVENSGWPAWVRLPAGIGEITGLLVGSPVSVLLAPTYIFDGSPESVVVRTSQGYGLRARLPTADMAADAGEPDLAADQPTGEPEAAPPPGGPGDGRAAGSQEGDMWIPLCLAPLEYGGGIGAGIVGAPFRGLATLFMDAPPPPRGAFPEIPEN